MKKSIYLILLTLATVITISCKKEKGEKETEKVTKDISNNINLSILLDLSDRISPQKYPNPTMEYYLRDVGYINSVSGAFTDHLRKKKIIQIDDKMQLFFEPAPLNSEINLLSKNLKIDVNSKNISKESIANIKSIYSTDPLKIYKLAILDSKYIGSDTWRFFKGKVDDYCIEDGYRNILIVLTDGYIFHNDTKMKEANLTTYLTPKVISENNLNSSDWLEQITERKLGFIKANKDLSNLEILVLGINPNSKNAYEEDVIKTYWSNWFDAMKVKKYVIKNADLPSNMDKIIKDFISNKN
jgi:hypothetical protein